MWSVAQINALAPDAASRAAAEKLNRGSTLSDCGVRAEPSLLWGSFKGSASKPYQVAVQLSPSGVQPVYSCTCPSRKFPCKHALGLMLRWSELKVPESVSPPQWVEDWLADRQARAERSEARKAAQAERAAAAADDPAAAKRANKAAERRAAQRAERITAGLDDLELWLGDQVRSGLTGLRGVGYRPIDDLARRLVDAQAAGVATRVRELASCLSAEDWPDRTLTEFSLLHLLIQGWRHRDALPAPLAATVRRRVGLNPTAAEIAADGEHVTDRWLVLGRCDVEAAKLVERRMWLQGERTGRLALLLSFAPPGQSQGLAQPVGAVFEAELAFAPEATQLRAVVVEHQAAPPGAESAGPQSAAPVVGGTLDAAAAAFAAALAADPWTTSVPIVLDSAALLAEPAAKVWEIADTKGAARVPLFTPQEVDPDRADRIRSQLLGWGSGHPSRLFGLYRPGGLSPVTVWSDGQAMSVYD
jgi:hypothetical protein